MTRRRFSKRPGVGRRRWLRALLAACLLPPAAVLAAGAVLWNTLPAHHATLRIPGLHHPVSAVVDGNGVPHIRADDLDDAAAAVGFFHARDRMFQMELMRRAGSGRLSELAGPAALPFDRTMRTLGLRRIAENAVLALPAPVRAEIEAYARGVNAAIRDRGRFISPEFVLFGPPEPWSAADTLLWGRLMALQLSGNWRTELARLSALDENKGGPRPSVQSLLSLWPSEDGTPAPSADAAPSPPFRFAALLDRTVPRWPARFTGPEEASDEWAVDGAHSATGHSLLAGDPHLALGFPAVWYLMRIDLPDRSLVGSTAPGTPFLVIGQNGRLAWTFTSNSADTQDLFIETLDGADRYRTPDGSAPFLVRTERIRVRGHPDEMLRVRETRHGPVISDLSPGPNGGGTVVAADMLNLRQPDAAPGLAALDAATDLDAAGRAAAMITTPVQNLLVADHDHIALFTTGAVPVRRAGDGSLPRDGASGAFDWTGLASGPDLPVLRDPPSGHLLNGNERTAPPDFPVFLGRDWPGDWRARRIRALLETGGRPALADFTRMQADDLSAFATAMRRWMRDPRVAPPPGGMADKAWTLLQGWDGRMDAAAPQPLIFNAWIQRFVSLVEAEGHVPVGAAGAWPDLAASFLEGTGAAWCGGDCVPLLHRAFAEAVASVARTQGADPGSWRWDRAHRAVFANAFLDNVPLVRLLARAEVPVPGDDTTLFRGGSGTLEDYTATHGGAYRGVYDLGDPEKSRFILTPGQSGSWLSPFAWNLMRKWAAGTTISIGKVPERPSATVELDP
ncbi:penicillin acylase family protein [Rhizosaccharibacter radicis]|uniref:Penicillin acylase family protein n=1 Tax=Rhizosaccharibacter radicis TaxID=2782605 RepID=A0ABT1W0Q4_9PROT|nr:penicillin acylase family protein [Acetobacteraceae bacterium KSS12]